MDRTRSARHNVLLCTSLFLAGGFFQSFPVTAAAQVDRERASFVIGAFITDRRSSTRLDSDASPGSDIELENDLGLETSSTVFRAGGYYWMKPRHRLDFSLFDLSRTSSKQIEETIEFGEDVFNIDTVVNTTSDLSIIKADYTYAVVNRERGFFGLTGGLYIADTSLTLQEQALGTFESEDLTAPLPVAGFRGEYEISDRFTLRGAGQWFAIDTGDVKGSLRDIYLGVDYGFNERMAIGLAYNEVAMNIGASESGGFEGAIDWGYDGFLIYFKMDFGNQ